MSILVDKNSKVIVHERAIQKHIEDVLAEEILSETLTFD